MTYSFIKPQLQGFKLLCWAKGKGKEWFPVGAPGLPYAILPSKVDSIHHLRLTEKQAKWESVG